MPEKPKETGTEMLARSVKSLGIGHSLNVIKRVIEVQTVNEEIKARHKTKSQLHEGAGASAIGLKY